MHVSFTANSAAHSQSCKGVMEYLDKENQDREKSFEDYISNYEEIKEYNFDKELLSENLFFTNDDEDGNSVFYEQNIATSLIDDNLSSRAKENESKFFMLNISPSKQELDHIEKLVNLEMKQQGFSERDINILERTELGQRQIEVIKNNLFHQNLREYSKDVMKDYAENFNRTVYNDPSKLPTRKEELIINEYAKESVFELGIQKNDNNYVENYQKFREEKAIELGRDVSVRPMTEKDLVWVGKIEQQRTYKGNDQWVIENRKINKNIDKIIGDSSISQNNKDKQIEVLKSKLHQDRSTGKVVTEGMKKGGKQYHIHVVVSRYDNCPNKRFKNSISPLANHKHSKIAGKQATVGFNRNTFFNKVEKSFDNKFRFERTQTYEKFNEKRNGWKKTSNILEKSSKSAINNLIQPIKSELRGALGLNELSKLNINNTISKELGFRIPLSIPTTPLQVATSIVQTFIGKLRDQGMGY